MPGDCQVTQPVKHGASNKASTPPQPPPPVAWDHWVSIPPGGTHFICRVRRRCSGVLLLMGMW